MRDFAAYLLCILMLAVFCASVHGSGAVNIDVCASVYRVVDGDTFDAFPVGRGRLADVNAPELDDPAGLKAKSALTALIERYGPGIYLDIDNVHVTDRYGRVVAVVYLRFNETHLLNVNKWLVENGFAEISDYDNEFDPRAWKLYLYHPGDPCQVVRVVTSTITLTMERGSTVTSVATATITVTEKLLLTVTMTIGQEVSASRDLVAAAFILIMLTIAALLVAGLAVRGSRRSRHPTSRK